MEESTKSSREVCAKHFLDRTTDGMGTFTFFYLYVRAPTFRLLFILWCLRLNFVDLLGTLFFLVQHKEDVTQLCRH